MNKLGNWKASLMSVCKLNHKKLNNKLKWLKEGAGA